MINDNCSCSCLFGISNEHFHLCLFSFSSYHFTLWLQFGKRSTRGDTGGKGCPNCFNWGKSGFNDNEIPGGGGSPPKPSWSLGTEAVPTETLRTRPLLPLPCATGAMGGGVGDRRAAAGTAAAGKAEVELTSHAWAQAMTRTWLYIDYTDYIGH